MMFCQCHGNRRPSIYEHIRSYVREGIPGLSEEGNELPDEARINEGSKIRWAPGAMDGVFGHHGGEKIIMITKEDRRICKLLTPINRSYCIKPSCTSILLRKNVISTIDSVIVALIGEEGDQS